MVAKQYEVTAGVRRINRLMKWMSRRGLGGTVVLTTVGHTSGESRSVPVSPLGIDGEEDLVAPYGDVAWVQNVRANNRVTIRKGKAERSCTLSEVTGEAGKVVAGYYARESFARPFMDVPENPSIEDFDNAASRFPVFRVT